MKTVFHPPFNKITVYGIIGTIVLIGVGSMHFGFVHQQVRALLFDQAYF
jgi:hypothetical protein